MGCIGSKHVVRSSNSPLYDCSVIIRDKGVARNASSDSSSFHNHSNNLNHNHNHNHNHNFEPLEKIKEETEDDKTSTEEGSASRSRRRNGSINNRGGEPSSGNNSNSNSNNKHAKRAAFSIKFGRLTEGEHVAAGWPAWLSAVAGEAIDGWIPLKSDSFERLEKIGQGTYSSVYRARDLQSGRMMALKKVRFDNFQPESVRFMAREITILRRLDHPNIMKLEGIITSRLSCSVYFVFEYMEHDLSGLLSCPDIKFSDSQIKCYMQQLLRGIEHCHSRGVLHRDIKASNILVNNEGLLKMADFGLANFLSSKSLQPLTSRVVTLWYRPPELLLGSTNYGPYVDIWSVGCVFAELFIGRPILKGRTEVEQLHKIFKLCGTPPDEYWKKSKLPLATMFKPQHAYESTLRERCKELPKTAVDLIETFLSIEPYKRGTATSALESEYFNTRPYPADPANLPKYPPNKEIDAKFREEARRKAGGKVRASGTSRHPRRVRKTLQDQSTFCKVVPTEEVDANAQARRNYVSGAYYHRSRGSADSHGSSKGSYDTVSEVSQTTEASQADSICTLPAQATAPSGSFAWATKRRKHGGFPSPSQNVNAVDPGNNEVHLKDTSASPRMLENEEHTSRVRFVTRNHDEIARHTIHRQQSLGKPDSLDSPEAYESQDLSSEYHQQERLQYSGPLIIQSHRIAGKQESHTRNGARRSRFYRDADM